MGETEKIVELDLGCTPEAAVSGARTIQTEHDTFLTFNAMRQGADGFRHAAGTALVEFPRCTVSKFGYPNDEAWSGIPRTRGLSYGIYEVMSSPWNEEIARLNRYSFPKTSYWSGRHFLFLFHDSSFECLADDIKLENIDRPYAEVLRRIMDRVLAT